MRSENSASVRLAIVIVAGSCGLVWAYWLGYLQQVLLGDVSRISLVICGVFALSVARLIITGRSDHLHRIETIMVTLGLIGNVVGFIVGLHEIDVSSISDPAGAIKLASQLIDGMGVAFYSTLTGAVAALWTHVIGWAVGAERE